jgi:hypothetical protein
MHKRWDTGLTMARERVRVGPRQVFKDDADVGTTRVYLLLLTTPG